MKKSRLWAGVTAIAATLSVASVSQAGISLPTPVIKNAQPQMIYSGSPGWLDQNGRIAIGFSGDYLGPDGGSHPADGGYLHVYVKAVSATASSQWMPCNGGSCILYGNEVPSGFQMGLDPKVFLQPGNHLQIKLWVSQNADQASDPTKSLTASSDWSAIYTIDSAPPGVKPPVAPPEVPTLSKVAPVSIQVGPGTTPNWTIRLYGEHLCGGGYQAIFDGDTANPVTITEHCVGYDDDKSFLPGDLSLFHVTVPEKYRQPHVLTVVVKDSEGISNPVRVVISQIQLTKAIAVPAVNVPKPQVPTIPKKP